MKFCLDHWARLRQKIDDRGLSALIAEGGERAAQNLASEIADGLTIDNFDPLMCAHNMIMSNCMKIVGIEIMRLNPDGTDRCPLCYMNAETNARGMPHNQWDDFLDKAADGALAAWKDMKP